LQGSQQGIHQGGGGSRQRQKGSKQKARRAGGGGRASRVSDTPGAPVEGAALRIDTWQAPAAAAAEGNSTPRSISKRDAAAFVRAVRRYGLLSHLADVAREVGGPVEASGPAAQAALWRDLAQGCRRALEAAADRDRQAGQLHDPREVVLDFFGWHVKALELSQHLSGMEQLEGQVQALMGKMSWVCACVNRQAHTCV
jgi:chromodomain-helicase-DNA-binding protein 1